MYSKSQVKAWDFLFEYYNLFRNISHKYILEKIKVQIYKAFLTKSFLN